MFEINLESHCIEWLSSFNVDCEVECMIFLSNKKPKQLYLYELEIFTC